MCAEKQEKVSQPELKKVEILLCYYGLSFHMLWKNT